MFNKIQHKSSIWDLHIHTCDCPKGSSEFSNISRQQFVEKLIDIVDNNSRFELFSFTDHNQISIEVYKEYIEQKGMTNFLVGVEQDVFFDTKSDSDYKHLLIYFDIDKNNFNDYIDVMEEYNKFVSLKPVTISELLNHLIQKPIKFVLSPHAFKQGKRGIENKWTTEDIANDKAHKYTDQFFCFWESQGYSQIAKAIEFLKEFDLDNKISVISFSDSNNFDKLNKYIEKPTQYFLSLPNFKGLELIASENSRILFEEYDVDTNNFGNLIGKVNFNGDDILFSNKLNCIIGGRGSGKSLLLDSIASNMKEINIKKDRKDYIDKFPVKVYNYSNQPIVKNNFNFDYFKQSYVSDLFDYNDYYKKISEQFDDELKLVPNIQCDEIKKENHEIFSSNLASHEVSEKLGNISDFINKYSKISDNTFKIPYAKKDKSNKKKIDYIGDIDFNKKIDKLVPKELKDDSDIKEAISSLQNLLAQKTHQYNMNLINTDLIKNMIIDEYFSYKKEVSEANKNKLAIEELLVKTFNQKGSIYSKRVNIINSYIKVQKIFKKYYEEYIDIDGEKPNAFRIKKVLKIETPFDYMLRLFNEYFYKEDMKLNKKDNCIDLNTAIEYYCFNTNKNLKDGKDIKDLDKALESFNLSYEYHPQILYLINDEYEDILNLSPGTQTNILMEYLVYKDTDKPLLIDQPEDNVDNQTIYNKLTTWFGNLKLKRQVIVVTHDANIVVNADTENVIIANHNKKDLFKYSYGALEFDNNLEVASDILDGGKEAVKRRLLKYGE